MKTAFEDGQEAVATGNHIRAEFWRNYDPRLYGRYRDGKGAGFREAAMKGKAGGKGNGKEGGAGGGMGMGKGGSAPAPAQPHGGGKNGGARPAGGEASTYAQVPVLAQNPVLPRDSLSANPFVNAAEVGDAASSSAANTNSTTTRNNLDGVRAGVQSELARMEDLANNGPLLEHMANAASTSVPL